jgi:FkbM family methyltransferase
MNRFAVNYAPLMTTFLIGETSVFRDNPIVIVDVGARGGIGREWDVLGDQLRAYAFEPDEEECRRLASGAPRHLTYIPRALGHRRGRQTFYQTALSDSAGIYPPRMDYLGRMLNRDNGVTVGEVEVEVSPLDDVLAEYKVPVVDFMKIDVEGAELDVLKGAEKLLGGHSPLGILSEIRFQLEIGSPPFAIFDVYLRRQGLRLFDLQFNHQSRRAMPYPGLQHYRRPSGETFFAYTSRGQLQDGDALYFRDLLLPSDAPLINQVPVASILKMCVFMEIFSLSDCAAELLLSSRNRIDELVDSSRLLDLLASGICGTSTTFQAYRERYFTEPTPTLQTPIFGPNPAAAASRGGWLRRLLSIK